MQITEIKVVLATEGLLRAFVTITLDNSLAIRDMKIIEGPNGLKIFQIDAWKLQFVLEFKEIEVVLCENQPAANGWSSFRIDC